MFVRFFWSYLTKKRAYVKQCVTGIQLGLLEVRHSAALFRNKSCFTLYEVKTVSLKL